MIKESTVIEHERCRIEIKPQRTQESPITVSVCFPPLYENFELKISATPRGWKYFYPLWLNYPQIIKEVIIDKPAECIYNQLIKKAPRGIQSGREDFTVRMKILIAYIDRWVTYWFGRKRKGWPKPLTNIARELKEELLRKKTPDGTINRVRISPHKVTAFILEKYYGEERNKHRLAKWTRNPDRFRRTYCTGNKFSKWFKNREIPPRFWGTIPIISGRDPLEFRNLVVALKPKLRIKSAQSKKSDRWLIDQPTE